MLVSGGKLGIGQNMFGSFESWANKNVQFSISKDFEMILWVIELEAKGVCLTQMTELTTKIPAKALENHRNFYGEFVPLFCLAQTPIIFMESLILAQSERWRRA